MLILKILEVLIEIGETTADVMFSGYAESYRKMRGINYTINEKIDFAKIERHRFYSLLSKLKSEGLVKKSKTENTNKIVWSITAKGLRKFRLLRFKKLASKNIFPKVVIPSIIHKDYLKVVVFDISEKERRKRGWIRKVLTDLDFKKLQQSVWIGDNKFPEDFFLHLRELNLLSAIHIFAVKRTGSLKL